MIEFDNEDTYQGLIDYFSNLPDEDSREYEVGIAKLSDYCATHQMISEVERIMNEGEDFAFSAFFCLCTLYRRKRDYELMHNLIENYQQFSTHPLFNHIVVQYQVHSETFYDYDELLEMAFRDAQEHPQNEGCSMAFCNAFATICEECKENREQIIDRWYDRALERIEYAIDRDPNYAKFYVAKARILALKKGFSDADSLIKKAISIEDSTRHDYAITVGTYQTYRLTYQLEKRYAVLEERVEKIESLVGQIAGAIEEKPENLPGDCIEPSVYDGDEPYAFISYAHNDGEDVYAIPNKLQKKGARLWFDKGIEPAAEWPEDVAEHLVNSKSIIVMLSPSSLESANVRREVNLALSEEKTIIIVVLDDVDLSPGMKLQFGLYQMIHRNRITDHQLVMTIIGALGKERCTENEY